MKGNPEIIANYCIGFVDLLGQRDEYKDEGLIPQAENEKKQFFDKINKTIIPIRRLQKAASKFTEAALNHKGTFKCESEFQQEQYDLMRETKVAQQRWSDGLVYFVSLHRENVKCPMNGIFHIFGVVGSLCFLGLCEKHPMRGAIDISWGVELHPGELYGAAVANAYKFESEIAQYPRIILGERVINYLEVCSQNPESDNFNKFNRCLAERCLEMIAIDFDGNFILDYLGKGFKKSITKAKHQKLFDIAFQFVNEQLKCWRDKKNTKLSMRYNHLFAYFQQNREK